MSSFGPMNTANPNTPGLAQYNGNPSNFKAFNTTPQYNNAAAQIGANTSNQQQQAQGRLAAMGAGRSAGAARQAQDIGAQGSQQLANFGANAAQQSFQDQLSQMNAANQFGLGNAQLGNAIYGNEATNNNIELARRQAANSALLGPALGALFGAA